jgi:hypothetical protein
MMRRAMVIAALAGIGACTAGGGGDHSGANGGGTTCGQSGPAPATCMITTMSSSVEPDTQCLGVCGTGDGSDICALMCGDVTVTTTTNTPGIQCGAACVDGKTNQNCGFCGNACTGGTVCSPLDFTGAYGCIPVAGKGGLYAQCDPNGVAVCDACFECFGVGGDATPRCRWPSSRPFVPTSSSAGSSGGSSSGLPLLAPCHLDAGPSCNAGLMCCFHGQNGCTCGPPDSCGMGGGC